jgi:hypothetical protein
MVWMTASRENSAPMISSTHSFPAAAAIPQAVFLNKTALANSCSAPFGLVADY